MRERNRIEVRGAPSRCPYCHEGLEAGAYAEIVACAACGARHHDSCFSEHGACATCGEARVLVPQRGSERVAPRARRGDVAEGARPAQGDDVAGLPALPRRTALQVARASNGSVHVRWRLIPEGQLRACLLLGALTAPLAGIGFYILFWALRHRQAFVRLTLGRRRLRFERPGSLLDRLSVSTDREDLGPVERGPRGLSVTVDGREQDWVATRGVGHILSADDADWLAEVVADWTAQAPGRRRGE